jgi:hypothetical protein
MKNEEESNTKLLGKIFVIVFIVIFIVILITLVEYVFSVNSHSYNLPTTTTKKIDYSYKDIDNATKLDYNTKLNNNSFLIPLNNAIDNRFNYTDIDLLQSEESKYKFIYTYITLVNKPSSISFADINQYAGTLFNTSLNENNFTKYVSNNNYSYDINYANPLYCLKADTLKKNKKVYKLSVDLVSFSSSICNANYLDYDNSNIAYKAILTVTKNGDSYYINSFFITE